ncbi:MAG: carbonic anhydrase family protein [Burkholderiaceae bacterium]
MSSSSGPTRGFPQCLITLLAAALPTLIGAPATAADAHSAPSRPHVGQAAAHDEPAAHDQPAAHDGERRASADRRDESHDQPTRSRSDERHANERGAGDDPRHDSHGDDRGRVSRVDERPRKRAGDEEMAGIDRLRARLVDRLSRTGERKAAAPKKVVRSVAPPAVGSKVVAHGGEIVVHARNHPHAVALARKHRRRAAPTVPPHGTGHGKWSYDGSSGPQTWADLDPGYALCGSGKRQSPIDIRDGIRVDLAPIEFDYRAVDASIIDNGHTIQIDVAPGNSIAVMGRRYELKQFHFHRPSEERVNGKVYDMVAHLVHKDLDGRLAVVAVLMQRGDSPNARHPLVQRLWNNMPLEAGMRVAMPEPIDLLQLLPTDRRYFTYMGSLTTPPCSEGVLWMVMKSPAEVSHDQVAIFSRLYPMNARPIQQASGRLIKESN